MSSILERKPAQEEDKKVIMFVVRTTAVAPWKKDSDQKRLMADLVDDSPRNYKHNQYLGMVEIELTSPWDEFEAEVVNDKVFEIYEEYIRVQSLADAQIKKKKNEKNKNKNKNKKKNEKNMSDNKVEEEAEDDEDDEEQDEEDKNKKKRVFFGSKIRNYTRFEQPIPYRGSCSTVPVGVPTEDIVKILIQQDGFGEYNNIIRWITFAVPKLQHRLIEDGVEEYIMRGRKIILLDPQSDRV